MKIRSCLAFKFRIYWFIKIFIYFICYILYIINLCIIILQLFEIQISLYATDSGLRLTNARTCVRFHARDSQRIYRANDLYANLAWKANPKLHRKLSPSCINDFSFMEHRMPR